MKAKALAIVAHPDDETIWMGNELLKRKELDWTIFSLCRASDKDRQPKFLRVCKFYGAEPIISDLEDDNLEPIAIEKIIEIISKHLKDNVYQLIFTHGDNGEYGHIRHKEVHLAVIKMIEIGALKAKKVFYFNYKKENGKCIAARDGIYSELSSDDINEKKRIITELYGFSKGSFEEQTCGNEGFKQK